MTTSEHVPSPPTAPGEASHSSPSARAEEAFVQVPPSTSREPHSATPARSPLPNSPHTPGAQTSGTVPQPRSTDGPPRGFKLPSWMNVLEENGTSLMYLTDDNVVPLFCPAQATMLTAELARIGLWKKSISNYKIPLVYQAVEEVIHQTTKVKAKELKMSDMLYYDCRIPELYVIKLGMDLLETTEGPHFTFIDPRRATRKQIIAQAVRMSREFGIKYKDRVVFSIMATEEGMRAASVLERRHGIRTNLTHVAHFKHAQVCIAAGASAITFNCRRMAAFVDDITLDHVVPSKQPWVQEIQTTMAYVHMNNCDTQIVVTDLLGIPNLQPLLGVDYVAIGTGKEQLDWPPQRSSYAPCKLFCASGSAPHILKARETAYPPDRALLKDTCMKMSDTEVLFMERLVYPAIDIARRDMWKLMDVLIRSIEDELELLSKEPIHDELCDVWHDWLVETYSQGEDASSQAPGPHQS